MQAVFSLVKIFVDFLDFLLVGTYADKVDKVDKVCSAFAHGVRPLL
jgi:hypothetical protein